jgi:predicted XRE-type DNA-binding protein
MRKKTKTYEKKLADTRVEVGSGNVYADLGFDNPEEMLAKAHLVSEMQKVIKQKKLTQTEAAEILGLTQPKLSVLLKGHFRGYSTDRLIRFLRILGQDVDIFISPKPRHRRHAHLHVYSSTEKYPMVAETYDPPY